MQAYNHYWGTASSSIYMKYGNLTLSGVFHIGIKGRGSTKPSYFYSSDCQSLVVHA